PAFPRSIGIWINYKKRIIIDCLFVSCDPAKCVGSLLHKAVTVVLKTRLPVQAIDLVVEKEIVVVVEHSLAAITVSDGKVIAVHGESEHWSSGNAVQFLAGKSAVVYVGVLQIRPRTGYARIDCLG